MFETEKQPETCTNGDPSSSGPAIVVTGLLKKCAERNSPPGVGKTHLSVALAEAAIQAGFGAYFMTAHDLVTDLGRAYREGRLDRRMRVYLAPKVLIIDEMGYLPLDEMGATIFFQLVSAPYECSIILTSNKSYGDWEFQSSAIRSLRRRFWIGFLHHSATINIRGE